MHLGNVYTALISWLSARSQGGRWLLRIEDLDPQRSRREYALLAMDDLRWLGLEWDDEPVWQSERTALYEEHFRLLEEHGLTYPCYCTRADILGTAGAPHESDGRVVYPGTCRRKVRESEVQSTKDTARKPAWRVMVPDEDIAFTDLHYGPQNYNLARHCGDFVVRRSDGVFAYQLAVVVDDALTGVTEVVRGRDLLLSAAQQIYLYRLFKEISNHNSEFSTQHSALSNPYTAPHFMHLPLLCNTAGQRLSKRDKALDMGELRRCYTAEELLAMIARAANLIGLEQTSVTLPELLSVYSPARLPLSDIEITQKA